MSSEEHAWPSNTAENNRSIEQESLYILAGSCDISGEETARICDVILNKKKAYAVAYGWYLNG
jgi:hypothetical protein